MCDHRMIHSEDYYSNKLSMFLYFNAVGKEYPLDL